jgi:UDP-N-acetylmuramate dehydrogenase
VTVMTMTAPLRATLASQMRVAFGDRLREGELMSRHTSARIGGPADFFVAAESADDLADAVREAMRQGVRYLVLGAGSNLLVSDRGVRGLVIKNRTTAISFEEQGDMIIARAESGVGLPALARQCILRGATGMEWAATVPGTVGGAVIGNAGAHGSDTAASIRLATILQGNGVVRDWSPAELKYEYRRSALKKSGQGVVLAAEFVLKRGTPADIQATMESFITHRKRTQPPGASIGSMFKNPANDYAGRLIEATGLKGMRIGKAEISPIHANFFVNLGGASANDVYALISLAQSKVREKFGAELELEIELVGDWGGQC